MGSAGTILSFMKSTRALCSLCGRRCFLSGLCGPLRRDVPPLAPPCEAQDLWTFDLTLRLWLTCVIHVPRAPLT